MFEFVEVSLDQVALLVDPLAEGETAGSGFLWRDVCPSPALHCQVANGVAVIGAVGK